MILDSPEFPTRSIVIVPSDNFHANDIQMLLRILDNETLADEMGDLIVVEWLGCPMVYVGDDEMDYEGLLEAGFSAELCYVIETAVKSKYDYIAFDPLADCSSALEAFINEDDEGEAQA